MNPLRKTKQTSAASQPKDAKRKGGSQVNDSEGAGSRCVLCREVIPPGARLQTITAGKKQFPVHAACLDRLHTLLHEAFESPLPTPTLTRSLTLGEFLLTKRPGTGAEILTCITYYYQTQTSQPIAFSVTLLDEQLRYTGFKVRDLEAALKNAVNGLAYLEPCSERGMVFHRLTAKGAQLVEHLPTAGD